MRTLPLRRRRALTAAVAATAALTLLAAACGSSSSGGGGTGDQGAPGPEALDSAKGVVKVSFWHAMDGTNGDALTDLVDQFNQAHRGKIEVQAVYQGKYDDAITKYKAAIQSRQTPSLIQVYDIGTRFMIDTKQVVPMQSFIDKDRMDVSDLQPNIRGYYSIGDKLYSMPFNTSMPILYYNKDAFRRAGLDPDKPPTTLDEIRQYAEKLSTKDGSRIGFGAAIYGWFVEQWTAEANQQLCNNGNGRDSAATALLVNGDTQVRLLQWWADMVRDGLADNSGRKTDDAQKAFKSGKVAMNIESTGVLRSYQDAAQGRFELGTGFYPKVDAADSGGPIIGGASLWIDGPGHSAAEQRAAWEFVKFLVSRDTQATWHTRTGYFPVSRGALDVPADRQWRAEHPQFDTAIRQLDQTRLTVATQGCLLGVMPQARKAVEDAVEAAILGRKSAKQALDDAVASLTDPIAKYNRAVGR
jgi:sn-glycerol 3-phosphate transport system substrate-binding protein